MTPPEIKAQKGKTVYVDNAEKLAAACAALSKKNEFAFDTEFDRFYREYGFKLSLMQIFDGDAVYLVDPIALPDLSALLALFEDEGICKVVYSCSEDIQVLKINGCTPRNIYDLQIAARLCNHPATSLASLLRDEFGIEFDKTQQRSNWRRRPLSTEQIIYAGNDVSRLLLLKAILAETADKRRVAPMIAEENKACEKIPVSEYRVKLSPVQKKKYDEHHRAVMLELLELRNSIAMHYNVPPANIVSDGTLEHIIEKKADFLRAPFEKGFSKRLSADEKSKQKFLEIIKRIHGEVNVRKSPERHVPAPQPHDQNEKEDTELNRKYAVLYDEIIASYGKDSGEFILRGFKKIISSSFPQPNKLKAYQQEIIDAACKKLNIDFK